MRVVVATDGEAGRGEREMRRRMNIRGIIV